MFKTNILFVLNDNPIDPLGVMYLIGNVKANFDVVFIKGLDDNRLKEVNINKYKILAFSTITGSHLLHNDIAGYFKRKNKDIITIMGGPHPTFFPKESLELSYIDYICIGEGIISLNKFINNAPTKNIIDDIKKFDGELEPIVDIDQLKINRDVIYNKDNRGNNPIKNFMGTFNCPYSCSYCFNQSYYSLYKYQNIKRVRYVDPNIFIKQIKECVDSYPTKFIYIQDDTFILNKRWFDKVTHLIKEKINLPYHCHIRCDLVTEDIINKLKMTGCHSITFAIENSNQLYRSKYLNRNMTNDKILYTAKLLHKYGIEFRIENMVGLPFNSIDDNLKTMELNAQCKPTIGWASLFQPFPNTELGHLCIKEKLWDGNIDNIKPGFFDTSPLNINNKKQIERLQKLFSLGVNNQIYKLLIPILIHMPFDNI